MPNYPEGVNPTEVLQDTIKKIYNERVRDWFDDLKNVDTFDLNVPRQAAFAACWHLDSDSQGITELRMKLFDSMRFRHAPELVGETTKSPSVLRNSKPKVTLFFSENYEDIEQGYSPVTGTIGFRLMNGISTDAELKQIARRIKSIFSTEEERKWKKGKLICSYSDWLSGYQLQLYVRRKENAKSLVNKILSIQGHAPDWTNFQTKENEASSEAYPTIPVNEVELGRLRKMPRRRPVATVVFRYAIVKMPRLSHPICLLDYSGRWANPLVS